MVTVSSVAEIAALIGEPARAAIMQTLMDRRALTAGELARVAGVTPQTASAHLARLAEAGLITVMQQGRHRYHRMASREVAHLMESLSVVAAGGTRKRLRTGPRDASMRLARTCYDHLAGRLAVALVDALEDKAWITIDNDEAGVITARGDRAMRAIGLEGALDAKTPAAPLCKLCLDWSERRPHLAGRLGAALCTHSLSQGWLRKVPHSRALTITPLGRQQFNKTFGISNDALAAE